MAKALFAPFLNRVTVGVKALVTRELRREDLVAPTLVVLSASAALAFSNRSIWTTRLYTLELPDMAGGEVE